MKKIAVIGSRNYSDYEFFKKRLIYLISNIKEDITFVSGGAKSGADFLIKKYCLVEDYKLIEHLPDYERYSGRLAPLKRNSLIVDEADMMVAFWNGLSTGTAYTVKLAQKKNIPIRIVNI